MKLVPICLFALALLAPGAALAQAEGEDPCAGRNPLYCDEGEVEPAPAPAPAAPEPESPDECEGRNPLYCGVTTTDSGEGTADDADVVVMPPGGCEGRNPRYCQEEAEPPPAAAEPVLRKERANPSSSNPNRNPNTNPNSNPNRRAPSGD